MPKNDGGSMYPHLRQHYITSEVIGSAGGASVRTVAAIAAMQGLIANKDFNGPVMQGNTNAMVKTAVSYADALIAALEDE